MRFGIFVLMLAVVMISTHLAVRLLLSLKLFVLDLPNERSSHSTPVPRGGGIAIVAVVLTALIGAQAFIGIGIDWRTLVIFITGSGFVALISWIDDVRGLGNRTRLVAHGLAAVNAIAVFGYWHEIAIPRIGPVEIGIAGLPLTVLWVVGLSNAYNFMDGIDGLAASQAVVSGLLCAVLGVLLNAPVVVAIGAALAAACAGFLILNWHPARIFMGDVGSVFIGYAFAVAMVFAGREDARVVVAAGLLFAPIVFDTGLTFFTRLVRGEAVFRSHRSHLYQRLGIAGFSHRLICLLYGALAGLLGLFAILWVTKGGIYRVAVLAAACLAMLLLWLGVKAAERMALRNARTAASHRDAISRAAT